MTCFTRRACSTTLAVAAVLLVWLATQAAPGWAAAGESAPASDVTLAGDSETLRQAELEARVAELIRRLGAQQYATREKAQAELERLGLAAFDALHEAQDSDDIEIALRARYLVRSMQVNWSRDSDPLEAKKILKNYGDKSESDRRSRMEQLARLEDGEGVPALCRLVRFETSNILSKRAALLVMNETALDGSEKRQQLAGVIRTSMGVSKRPAAQWLRAYARTLEDPAEALDEWERLTRNEEMTLAQFPDRSTPEITRDLLRYEAELLRQLGREDASLAVIRRTIDLLDGTRGQLIDMVDWLMQREAFALVDEVAGRFPARFDEFSLLLYRQAESQLKRGEGELASRTAEKALQVEAEDPERHNEVGKLLWDRGLIDWAEREFRHVMDLGPKGSITDLYSRFLLSEMLHDSLREKEAAETLQGVVEAMDADPVVLQRVQQWPFVREPQSIRSRMHFFFARHHSSVGERAKQVEQLKVALESDPTDADVLIAMYRLPDADAEWRELTLEKIEAAADHFRGQIRHFQQQVENENREQFRMYYNYELARQYNQFAWLIGNTEGDLNEALRYSHLSLELRPDSAGFLDTLARCYYAVGDLEQAVKHQQRAVELEPHSLQIARQLKAFRDELAKSQEAGSQTAVKTEK